jgi:putative glutamine amidotransferase
MKPVIGVTCSTMDAVEGRGVRRMQVPAPYVERVVEAGGLPLLLPVVEPALVADYLALVDGLVLVGGDDVDPALYGAPPHPDLGSVDPARDRFEIALLRAAAALDRPTLGICRGVQVMNVAFGGTLHQHLPATVPGALDHGGRFDASHGVSVVPGTRLAAILGAAEVAVNSHHHQAIERVAPSLVVSARAADGVVEGAEDPSRPFLVGVQWHPERLASAPATKRLFDALIAASRRTRR